MSITREFFKEVLGMFLADMRLTIAILVLVSLAGALAGLLHAAPLVCGGVLLVGSLAILVATTCHGVAPRTQR